MDDDGDDNGDGCLATRAVLERPSSVFQYKHEIYIGQNARSGIRKIDPYGIITTIPDRNACIITDSIFVHNDEVYYTNVYHLLCKIQCNGMTKTIAGLYNISGIL